MNLSVVFSNSICSSAGPISCWYDGPSTCKRLQFAIDSMVIEIVDLPIDSMVIVHRFLMFFVCLPEGMFRPSSEPLPPNHWMMISWKKNIRFFAAESRRLSTKRETLTKISSLKM